MNHVDSTQNVISFCTGLRGIERGLEMLFPIKAVCFVEIEAFIISNLVAEMEKGFLASAPIWSDAKTFNPKPFRGKVHGIVGGYPCQPFSRAGNRGGEKDPRHLWPNIRATIEATRPFWCFFENVSDHLSMGFDEVYKSLRHLGYRVEAGLFSAEEVGATHLRERLFILAVDDTRGIGFEPEYQVSAGWHSTFLASKELANATKQGLQKPGRESGQSNQAGEELADTTGFGSVYGENQEQPTEGRQQSFGNASTSSGEMAHPDDIGWENRVHGGEQGRAANKPGHSVKEMADTDSKQHDGTGRAWQRGAESSNRGSELADSESIGLQGGWKARRQSSDIYGEQELFIWRGCWPAGQGPYQHEWEEPRTIESGVGCTINGYNFREDLIRAFGNSVVSQVAAKAFYFLHKKIMQ